MRVSTSARLLVILSGLVFCFLPFLAFAQDEVYESRIIDIPNIKNGTSSLSSEFREIFSSEGHLVFNEVEMMDGAKNAGVFDERYWENMELLAKVNKKLRHDALILLSLEKGRRKDSLMVDVINGFSGEKLAAFELGLAKKGKLSKTEKKKLKNAITPLILEVNASLYPMAITIKIDSTPSGASILRNGQEIGVTPYVYETDSVPNSQEQWVISLEGYSARMQNVDLSASQDYSVVFGSDEEGALEDGAFLGKVRSGTGRPILMLELGVDVGLRSLSSSVSGWTPISYSTSAYPVIAFGLEFYPFSLFVNNEYLAGLGAFFNFGVGFLTDKLQLTPKTEDATTCKQNSDGTYSCDTLYSRFQFGLIYRLLFQKRAGKLNPNGMALDFLFGYNWSVMEIEKNPLYRGHGYQGVLMGMRFSTALGLEQLRAQLGLNFIYNVGFRSAQMIGTWGTSVDNGWGISPKFDLLYDIWKGLFVKVGYQLNYFQTKYAGTGCMNPDCNQPTNSETKDLYHEILIGFGWMLY